MSSEHLPKEHFKDHQKELEKNALAESLTTGWDKFKQGKLVSYRVMALSLIAVTAVALFFYIRYGKRVEASSLWTELEAANTLDTLEEYAKKHPNTPSGNAALLHTARFKLARLGIDTLDTRDEAKQKKAAAEIEAARDTFEQLIGVFKDDPVNKVQSILGRAKAEAALIGMFKDGMSGEQRGTVPKLIEWLEKLAAEAADTPWGEDAKKHIAALKAGPTAEEVARVQRGLYTIDRLPDVVPGGFKPKSPLDVPPTGTLPVIPGSEPKKELPPKSPGDVPPEKPKDAAPPKAPDPAPPKAPDPKPPEPAPKPAEKK